MRTLTLVVLAVLVVLSAVSLPASAQQDIGRPGPMMQSGEKREFTPEQFNDMKARALKMIEERKTRLDQEKSCVETATNMEELRKCRPERPMGPDGGFRGGMQEGQDRQRPQR